MDLDDTIHSNESTDTGCIAAQGGPVLVMIDCRNGTHALADASAPQLRVNDLAVSRGDGVFEAMLATAGVLRKPEAHLRRLAVSAANTELAMPAAQVWRDAIATALRAHRACAEALVKLMLSRGPEGGDTPSAWVTVSDCSGQFDTARCHGIDALLLERGYDSQLAARAPWLLLGTKTLSYAINMAALRHARTHGADDVVFVSADGLILEGPTSNVITATGSGDNVVLRTPPPECGILAGTTQAALFDAAQRRGWRSEFAPLTAEDLYSSDGVWLASSIRLLAPVNRLDGHTLARSHALDEALFAMLDVARP